MWEGSIGPGPAKTLVAHIQSSTLNWRIIVDSANWLLVNNEELLATTA